MKKKKKKKIMCVKRTQNLFVEKINALLYAVLNVLYNTILNAALTMKGLKILCLRN